MNRKKTAFSGLVRTDLCGLVTLTLVTLYPVNEPERNLTDTPQMTSQT